MDMYSEIDEYYIDFKKICSIDIFKKTRKTEYIVYRALFYRILECKAGLSLSDTARYFTHKGLKCCHSKVLHGLKMLNIYYDSYGYLRNAYDVYFTDKVKINKAMKQSYSKIYKSKQDLIGSDKLVELINSIPKNRREEIYNIVNLRVKSWEWKSKDSCKVYQGSESILNN